MKVSIQDFPSNVVNSWLLCPVGARKSRKDEDQQQELTSGTKVSKPLFFARFSCLKTDRLLPYIVLRAIDVHSGYFSLQAMQFCPIILKITTV